MLKTFTVLVTVPEQIVAAGIEGAMFHGVTAIVDGEVRVDAFEGEHLDTSGMREDMEAAANDAISCHEQMRESTKPRTWADLTRDEQTIILNRASADGGGFVSRLADAWKRADSANSAKLGEAFGAMLLESYGDSFKG